MFAALRSFSRIRNMAALTVPSAIFNRAAISVQGRPWRTMSQIAASRGASSACAVRASRLMARRISSRTHIVSSEGSSSKPRRRVFREGACTVSSSTYRLMRFSSISNGSKGWRSFQANKTRAGSNVSKVVIPGFAVHRYMNVLLSFISNAYEKLLKGTSWNACIYVDCIKARQ